MQKKRKATHALGPAARSSAMRRDLIDLNGLALLAQADDREAWKLLLERLQPVILGRARRWQVPGMEKADVIQEARLATVQAVRTWPATGGSSCSTWTHFAIDSRLHDLKRAALAEKRAAGWSTVSLDRPLTDAGGKVIRMVDTLADPEVNVEAELMGQLAAEHLAERCRRLVGDPTDRAILDGFIDGDTQEEIAAAFGIRSQSVSARVARIRNHLAEQLKELLEDYKVSI